MYGPLRLLISSGSLSGIIVSMNCLSAPKRRVAARSQMPELNSRGVISSAVEPKPFTSFENGICSALTVLSTILSTPRVILYSQVLGEYGASPP